VSRDFSLEEASTGAMVAHLPDCPQVRALADRGEMVLTMLDCQKDLPAWVARHECLEEGSPSWAQPTPRTP
jgi:hypothetical protein